MVDELSRETRARIAELERKRQALTKDALKVRSLIQKPGFDYRYNRITAQIERLKGGNPEHDYDE